MNKQKAIPLCFKCGKQVIMGFVDTSGSEAHECIECVQTSALEIELKTSIAKARKK